MDKIYTELNKFVSSCDCSNYYSLLQKCNEMAFDLYDKSVREEMPENAYATLAAYVINLVDWKWNNRG